MRRPAKWRTSGARAFALLKYQSCKALLNKRLILDLVSCIRMHVSPGLYPTRLQMLQVLIILSRRNFTSESDSEVEDAEQLGIPAEQLS